MTTSSTLSAWLLAGRVTSQQAATATEEARRAEEIGFRRVFLSERYNIKEAGAVLGGVGASTSTIGFGTGVLACRSRHPLMMAALGATLHAAYGPRFTLGIGRSEASWVPGQLPVSFDEIVDYVSIMKRLWAGETVTYDGPAGRFEGLALGDTYDGPAPEVWLGMLGLKRATDTGANPAFDGVMLSPMITPEATQRAVEALRKNCERHDRDPASLRILVPVVTAPDLDEKETRELCHARFVTYVTWPNGHVYEPLNGWDRGIMEDIRNHAVVRQAEAMGTTADYAFHREELGGPASLVPDEWMAASCAIGSVDECVAKLREYMAAGVDEIAVYGSTVQQNAKLAERWIAETERAPVGASSS